MTTAPRGTVTAVTKALAAALDERKLSYRDVATIIGCSHAQVGHIVTGKSMTTFDRAEKIASMLDLPIATLFRWPNGDLIGGAW